MSRARALCSSVVAAALAALSCSDTLTIGPGDVVAVRVAPDSVAVRVGSTRQLQAVPLDSTQALVSAGTVTWSSSAPGVASVDTTGLVTGVASGSAIITARAQGIEGSAVVAVDVAPLIQVTADSVGFAAQAGGAEPAPDSVIITNGGGFSLVGLSLGTITYGDTTVSGWLAAVLDSAETPATLVLTATTIGITTAGVYTASVPIESFDADNSPRVLSVTLVIGAAAPAAVAVSAGDGQTATVGTAVATAPSVFVTDQFGNAVPGAAVTFSVISGAGSLTDPAQTTDAAGLARVGAWVLGPTAGENRLRGTTTGVDPATFTGTGVADVAAQIGVGVGDNQSAIAGAAVGVSPAVLVADQFGNGVAGVTVTFAVTGGGGSVTGATPVSDSAGVATVGTWTLGDVAGINTMSGTAAGLAGSPVGFTATGLAGSATDLVLESGDAQTDTVAATLAQPYAVKVTDAIGNPVSGIPVGWIVTGGGGSVTPSSTTGADGIATAVRTLGNFAGQQTASASVGGLTGSPVPFTATATAAVAAVIAATAGDGQTATVGTDVATNPSVLVTDQFGNPVGGHSVVFAVSLGGGSIAPTTAVVTNAAGVAAVTSWMLGTVAGTNNNAVQATAAGASIAGNPLTFTASATVGPATSITPFAGDNQTAVAGAAVTTAPAVQVSDTFGNLVAGVAVTFSVPAGGGGGAVTGASQTTNAVGVATVGSWTLGDGNAMSLTGTFDNTLNANSSAGTATISASAIYSYATHVQPIWDGSCVGCHGGINGLFLNPPVATSHGNIVGVPSTCDAAVDWIETNGGAAAENASIIMRLMDTQTSTNVCGTAGMMPTGGRLSAAIRDVIRAWIRNGALLN